MATVYREMLRVYVRVTRKRVIRANANNNFTRTIIISRRRRTEKHVHGTPTPKNGIRHVVEVRL